VRDTPVAGIRLNNYHFLLFSLGKIPKKYFEIGPEIYVNQGNPVKFKETVEFEFDVKIGKGTKIESGAMIYPNCTVGENCIIGAYAVLKPDTHIGNHSIFGTLSTTEGNVRIGDWTTIHSQCHVTWGMKIGSRVFIGPLFYSANTPKISLGKFGYPNTTNDPRLPPIIEDGARIGENVGLAPGVRIGKNALIDMACLVTKDVKPGEQIRAGKEIVGRVIHQNR
jgi:UDP-3-O-[3-hydroxymyristoyl] glucosamine N-acyltransferase